MDIQVHSGPARQCGSFHAGHDVHFIQALRGSNPPTATVPVPGRLIEAGDDGTLIVEVAGETVELWNHDPARVATLVAVNGGAVAYQKEWSLLRTKSPDGDYLFSVCRADARRPCPTGAPPEDLVQLLEERGGFVLTPDDMK